jgi:CheY-like chemotaxis protein
MKNEPRIVLHIDDDPDDRLLVSMAIQSIDPSMILREAKDGMKAIEFLDQAKLFGDLPCLIILDLNMPVMNGYETYKEIRKDDVLSAIPIVIFTTSFDKKDQVHWARENVALIVKPAQYDDFVENVKKILTHCARE